MSPVVVERVPSGRSTVSFVAPDWTSAGLLDGRRKVLSPSERRRPEDETDADERAG